MIAIRGLTVSFPGGPPVVDGLSLTVPSCQTTVVVGESGSGKSVMLSSILHILPPAAAVSGSIRLDGRELLDLPERELRRLRGPVLAYIPQGSGNGLDPLFTAGYQVAEPMMTFQKLPRRAALDRAVDWMRQLKLGSEERVARSYPHTLSGGMKQRVLIAMGVAAGAEVLLADEPTKGLDQSRIRSVIDLFEKLGDKTILCVSHDLRFTRAVADQVCVMYAAQQIEWCRKDDFFRQPLHPYSQMLMEALPENGMKAPGGFAPSQGNKCGAGCRFYDRCPHRRDVCRTPPPVADINGRKVRCHLYAD